MHIDSLLQINLNSYRFDEDKQISLRSFLIRISILQTTFITETDDVVHGNVPFLIGLDLSEKYNLYVNKVENVRGCASLIIEIPLQRQHDHIYLVWDKKSAILYTRQELLRLHKTFSRPPSDNLYNVLKLV